MYTDIHDELFQRLRLRKMAMSTEPTSMKFKSFSENFYEFI